MTLKVMSQDGKTTSLVNTTEPDAGVSLKHERLTQFVNGARVPHFRLNALYARPVTLSQPGCNDACGPVKETTDLVRVQCSGMVSRKAEIIALLEDYVKLLKSSACDNLWNGFPIGQADIEFPVVV